jgi:hypothetical protein
LYRFGGTLRKQESVAKSFQSRFSVPYCVFLQGVKQDGAEMKTICSFVFLLCFAVNLLAQTESIVIEQRADTVIVTNLAAWENCAAGFKITVVLQGNSVVITETDTVWQKARCMCHFDVSAALSGLAAGTYTVEIYRQYWKQFNYPEDKTALIGTATFDVVQPGASQHFVRTVQSDCYQVSSTDDVTTLPDGIALDVFPNPVKDDVTVRITCAQSERVTMLIFDESGNEAALPEEKNCRAGLNEFTIPSSLLKHSGMYYCVLRTRSGISTRAFSVFK